MNRENTSLDSDLLSEAFYSYMSDNQLSIKIDGQIEKLNELDGSVNKAVESAEKAKLSAQCAKDKAIGFLKKKAAIEELQTAVVGLAEAGTTVTEAQKILFEFQTQLAETTKFLFGLGVSNLASNRSVVRELELKLRGASREELSELARQEILRVVEQLKKQEDILTKQDKFSETSKIHDKQLAKLIENEKKHEEKFEALIETSEWNYEQLKALIKVDERQEERLKDLVAVDEWQDEQIKTLIEYDKQQDEQLKALVEVDEEHSEKLRGIDKKSNAHDEKLLLLHEKEKTLTEQLETNLRTIHSHELEIKCLNDEIEKLNTSIGTKANSSLVRITLVIAILALVVAVIHFFI